MTMWTNDDGLHVKFGNDEAELTTGGASSSRLGALAMTELKVFAADISSTAGTIPYRSEGVLGVEIPKGVMIAKVELFAEEAVTSSGGSATLDIGLKKQDDTELDYDGLVDGIDIDSATDGTGLGTIGNTVVLTQGSTGNGAKIGTITTDAGFICMNYATEALTDGIIVIRVYYYRPHSTDATVL